MTHRRGILAGAALILLAAATPGESSARCGDPLLADPGSPDAVTWVRVEDAGEREDLDLWCAAVGPAVSVAGWRGEARVVERIAIASWNVHVGGGNLKTFLHDLRAGTLSNVGPVSEFVLILQEALRIGAAVPEAVPKGARAAPRILESPRDGKRVGVDELARSEGLFAFYAPSMRNGTEAQEDRGNAILSTLPLTELTAIELPLERQRRVALAATVRGTDSTGAPWQLRVVNVHLDNWSSFSRLFESFGSGRARQIGRVVAVLGDAPAVVLGGDLNTWFGEFGEPAIDVLRAGFPLPEIAPPGDTHAVFGGLAERRLDHLAFRLPAGWTADYRVLEGKFHSDHTPLVGDVIFSAAPPGRSAQ